MLGRRLAFRALSQRRIPVIDAVSAYPYVLAFDSFSSSMPTRAEICLLTGLLDSLVREFPVDEFAVMRRRPYDLVMTMMWQTIIFHKYGKGDWGVRRQSLATPCFWPYTFYENRENIPPHALLEVLEGFTGADAPGLAGWRTWREVQ